MSFTSSVQKILRKALGNTKAYSFFRRLFVFQIFALRRPHEDCYYALPGLAGDDGVFLDVGANAGQTAAAVARLLPKHQIICVEPNPQLRSELAWVQKFVGARMTVVGHGLSSKSDVMDLFIPHDGALDFEARASLDKQEACAHAVELTDELNRPVTVRHETVDVKTLDSLGVFPDIIKIDVEGFEHEVLNGALQTLSNSNPVILFEENTNIETCIKSLVSFGYLFFKYTRMPLSGSRSEANINMIFAIPEERKTLLQGEDYADFNWLPYRRGEILTAPVK
ncbi:MAG: hypothetical protein DHS20C05_17420 [Hyphococcus sp.]|nr:MAG: hypothetical protein DHS20C05_17420 [Marinicaulis sp.]